MLTALSEVRQAAAHVKRVIVSEFLDERRRRGAETGRWDRATTGATNAAPEWKDGVA